VVALFPPPGLRDPAAKQPMLQAAYDRSDAIGKNGFLSYTFEDEWELVPGVWTLQIWNAGRKLAEQKFTVIRK
jgi:hypothetical protein